MRSVRVVDLGGGEEGVDPEGPGLVRDDRHDPPAELMVAHQITQDPDERHRGGGKLRSGAALGAVVDVGAGMTAGWLRRSGRKPPSSRRRSTA